MCRQVLQDCQGFTSGSSFWHRLLALPAARLLGAIAPHTAAWLLYVCALQHAEYTLVKVRMPAERLHSAMAHCILAHRVKICLVSPDTLALHCFS